MITKGKSTTGRSLAAHLMKPENERVEVLGIRGAALEDLREAIDDWRDYAKGTNCDKPIYHAQLNPDRDLSREEWETAIGIFEKELGLENYPRAVVLHEKEGREHIHLVYSRFDHDPEAEHMRAWSDSWNYPKHERASREIERALGLQKTQGVFIDREGPRPERTPTHDAMQQGDRLQIDPRDVKAEIAELYRSADTGPAFVAALDEAGYTLAQGDKRGYVILDQAGGVHSLSRMAGVKVGELRERLGDYALENLPSVAQAREAQQERTQAREVTAPELGSREEERAAEPAPEATTSSAAEIDRAAFDGREADAPAVDLGDSAERGIGGAVDAGIKVLGKALDGFATSFESLFAEPPKPPTREDIAHAEAQADDREARIAAAAERIRLQNADYQQQQEREQAQGLDQGRSLDLFRK